MDFVGHEIGNERVWVLSLLSNANRIPSRQTLERIVVTCISGVELIGVQEDAGQRYASLDVTLEIVWVLNEVEGVAGVGAKSVCLCSRPLQYILVKADAVQSVVGHVCGVADVELGGIEEHRQLKTHRRDRILP